LGCPSHSNDQIVGLALFVHYFAYIRLKMSYWGANPPGLSIIESYTPLASGSRTPDLLDARAWRADEDSKEHVLSSGQSTPRQEAVAKALASRLESKMREGAGTWRSDHWGEQPWDSAAEAVDQQDEIHDQLSALPPLPPSLTQSAYLRARGRRKRLCQNTEKGRMATPTPQSHTDLVMGMMQARSMCPYSMFRPHAGIDEGFCADSPVIVSMGSVGHPTACAGHCVAPYCQLGASCPKCHLCKANEASEFYAAYDIQGSYVAQVARENTELQASAPTDCPSVGSMGHPETCADACKYHWKSGACKDGSMCVRCHVCPWRRQTNGKTNYHSYGRKRWQAPRSS